MQADPQTRSRGNTNQIVSPSLPRSAVRMPNPWFAVAGGLLFLMVFVPTAYRPIKAVLLGLVLVGVVAPVLRSGRIFLHRSIVGWTLVMVLTGVFGILIGSLNDAPGALRVSTVYVFWPMLFTLLASGIRSRSTLDGLMRVLVLATFAIGLYSLSFVLYSAGWLPWWLYIELDQGQEIGFYEGFIEFNLYSTASLFFLVPFSLAALLTWRRLRRPPVSRRWLWISVALALMASLLSGRRALWLILVLSPVITLAFYLRLGRRRLRFRPKTVLVTAASVGVVVAALQFAVPYAYEFSMSSIVENVREAFDFDSDLSASIRQEQLRALVRGWLANPLFGAGHGASAAAFGSVRSDDQSWSVRVVLRGVALPDRSVRLCGLLGRSAVDLSHGTQVHSVWACSGTLYGSGTFGNDLFSHGECDQPVFGQVRLPVGDFSSGGADQLRATAFASSLGVEVGKGRPPFGTSSTTLRLIGSTDWRGRKPSRRVERQSVPTSHGRSSR